MKVTTTRIAARFGDDRITAFTRRNLAGMVADARTAGATVALALHWRRDLADDVVRRRARHQAHRWPAIFAFSQEVLHTLAFDEAVRDTAVQTGTTLVDEPERIIGVEKLARAIARRLDCGLGSHQ